MANPAELAPKLLDFDHDLDIPLIDSVVRCMYSGSGEEQQLAQQVLATLKDHPEAWTRVLTILDHSSQPETKHYGLLILEGVIKSRWQALPREQCEVIKGYIGGIIKTSADSEREQVFLQELYSMVLIPILKREWPKHWHSFISEIVSASKDNKKFSENVMSILKLLSEEVLDFSFGNMTQIKAKDLKDSMGSEFSHVFQLCQFLMDNSENADLGATLQTLLRFLSYLPLVNIFETKLIRTLIFKFLNVPLFRNVTLKCLTKIAGLAIGPQYDDAVVALFSQTMSQLEPMLSLNITNGQDAEQDFLHNVGMFMCTMLRQHGILMERRERENIHKALDYLLLLSEMEETEIFKICLEYWNALAEGLYRNAGEIGSSQVRRIFYQSTLSRLRSIFISRMVKPGEVLVIENENGEVVRQTLEDTESTDLYKSMRETLVYLTHLDQEDTERILTDKLQSLVNGSESEWSWKKLNTLCWAVGSMSGAMHEEVETRSLFKVTTGLIGLSEKKKGEGNRVIICSNIMYVLGQNPRFLRANWKFLNSVVYKLFDFMHEENDAIKEMACDTFIKIAQKCGRELVQVREGQTNILEEILNTINIRIRPLLPQQVFSFYEAVGRIISAESEEIILKSLIERYMILPNHVWDNIINQATRNVDVLKDADAVKQLANILQINVSACKALGHPYVSQLNRIYLDMLKIYKLMSQNISGLLSGANTLSGENMTQQSVIKNMRLVRKETIKLINEWVSSSSDPALVLDHLLPPLISAVLGEYQHCAIPSAREPEVLSTMATIVNKLEGLATSIIPKIFDTVFQCTLDMINKNFEEYPEHRTNFYVMLEAVNKHCFSALVSLPPAQFKLVLNSFIWAFKHTMHSVAETGSDILHQLLQNVSQNDATAQAFYTAYYTEVLQHVLSIVTDTSHAATLTKNATILAYMFTIVEMGKVKVSLNPATPVITPPEDPVAANTNYVCNFVAGLFQNAFPHLTEPKLKVTAEGLFHLNQDLTGFKEYLRDFLVQIKEFTGDDNSNLYLEERELEMRQAQEEKRRVQMSVPGILNPHEIAEDMQN